MTLPNLRPHVSKTPLLAPRVSSALRDWLATGPNVPWSGTPIAGVLQFLHIHARTSKAHANSLILAQWDDRSVETVGVRPVVEGSCISGVGLPGYAELRLEFDDSEIEAQLENARSDLYGSPGGIWYHAVHGYDASLLALADPEAWGRLWEYDELVTSAGPRSEILSVHYHDPEPSGHARLGRLSRLDALNRAIEELWEMIGVTRREVGKLTPGDIA